MNISRVAPFILHIPVTGGGIADSTHSITHWGVVGASITTDQGLTGWGFTGTHAHLPSDRLITACIRDCYSPLLVGKSAADLEIRIDELAHHPPVQWVGRAGITQLALAAIDTALWDLRAKAAEKPLWNLLTEDPKDQLMAYNTDIGWLSIPTDQLIQGARQAIETGGFRGIKIKVGSADPETDVRRLEAVRKAIGPDIMLAVDANGKWTLEQALAFCSNAEGFDVHWFEEPLWYDDVVSHRELAQKTRIPVALGEQLYSPHDFVTFIDAKAVHFVQPDVTRLAGISDFLKVADFAHARQLPVAAHVGDMGQVHVHLSFAHPACPLLEYIPWIKDAFEDSIRVEDGNYLLPQLPGAGTTPKPESLERYAKPL
ncbi:MAG: mandelate racemase/muconate lactonizing enzyme family protein [Verrucomicrobiae bacterium]|nr:mandelate racemase/muconate lactonizing enzyme family protein [Verrucomicrobiae bacterium]